MSGLDAEARAEIAASKRHDPSLSSLGRASRFLIPHLIVRESSMKRQQVLTFFLIVGCFAVPFLASFGEALFHDGQFGYRDAGHFYYPLYQRVQAEWDAKRWPLWEPEENSGMPLLGNPTAAVLYPGKVIYALFPYAWAARLYVIAHLALAFVAMLAAMRSWQVSWVGAAIAALTYAFGVPILFQYCNIIYLVGAAWLPLGFMALDRWIRGRSLRALLGLAAVLSMQTLGGDPQSAYLLGLCGGAYALGLAWSRAREQRPEQRTSSPEPARPMSRWWVIPVVVLGLALWIGGTIAAAEAFPRMRGPGKPAPALWWMLYVPRAVTLAWGMVAVWLVRRWRSQGWRSPLGVTLLGLVGSALLAGALTAAQLLPVVEFTQQTVRAAGEGPHDIYPFSVEPFRLAELVWPSVFGTSFGRNAYWIEVFRLPGVRQKIWIPSLYVGCLGFLLAAGAVTIRRGPARRVWLSVIVLVSLVGSLGQYTSPIWAARVLAATAKLKVPDIGPLDTNEVTPIRLDRYLRDGDGSIYWWMTTVLPGFRQFRFPAKLLTFSTFGLAALAGMGWDGLRSGRRRGTVVLAALLMAVSLGVLAIVLAEREAILKAFQAGKAGSAFGPLDAPAAFTELVRSLVHGAVMLAVALVLIPMARRRPGLAGSIALLGISADLAVANARYVITVPQSIMETEPDVVRIIKEAERANPSPVPYRIHRMPQWNPASWLRTESAERVSDFVTWERETIQPKYGINLGIEYTHTIGVAELYDYEWFFSGFPRKVRGETARMLGLAPGKEVVYFPRRSFDMWNSRYFVLPEYPNGWLDEYRGYAAFLHETERIYPPPDRFASPEKTDELKAWIETHDYQIRRNLQVFPRAWVVHDARGLPALEGLTRLEQSGPMQEMIYSDDPIWQDPNMHAYDPRRLVWIDNDERLALREFLTGASPRPTETVKVTYPDPQSAELEAKLDSPGIVVLADVWYPGWKLTIDGRPAPIYRVNRLMRGAAVPEGTHRLVYTFEPRSFEIGKIISLAGLAATALLAAFSTVRPRLGGPGEDTE
jgi:hypothetical protein